MSEIEKYKKCFLWLRYVATIGVVVGFSIWLDVGDVVEQLKRTDYVTLVVLLCLVLASSLFEAAGVSVALRSFGARLGALKTLMVMLQVRFYSVLLPGVVSTGMKWYRVIAATKRPVESISGLAMSRVCFVYCLLVIGAVAMLLDNEFPWPAVGQFIAVPIVGTVGLFGILVFLHKRVRWLSSMALDVFSKVIIRVPTRIGEKLERIAAGFTIADSSQIVAMMVVFLTAHVIGSVALIVMANTMQLSIPVVVLFWIRAVVTMCTMIPLTVAGLGIREVSMLTLLAPYGINQTEALSFSLLFFVVFVLFRAMCGLVLEFVETIRVHRFRLDDSESPNV